ncbi:MAG: radical SAM protein [Nitrospirae bacterium]|nr:radical SAM protein [Nitrospirota bacterium]
MCFKRYFKMKVLLLRAPLKNRITADMSDIFDEDVGVYPPLGLLYLHASLRQMRPRDEVNILDCISEGLDRPAFIGRFLEFKPDIVGITVLTFHLLDVYRCAAAIKKNLPDTIIVLGGPHAHLFPEETLGNPDIDYVITGEGEFSFPLFIDNLENGTVPSDVPGIFYRGPGDSIVRGNPPTLIKNLDTIPPIDFSAVRIDKYMPAMEKEQAAILMSSRGCPYKCIYCDRPHLGNIYRTHSPMRVVDDMKRAVNRGIRSFQFFDDTFTIIKSRVLEICDLIAEEGLNITFSIRARVNTVNEELLIALKKAGCRRISFGVEAGSNRMLKSLRKNITVEEVIQAFRLCKKIGIETLADFIIGGPDQTRQDVLETIDFALRLNPSYAQFTIMTPFPGTDLYQLGMDKGLIKTDYWREFAKNPAENFETPVWEEHLKREELLELFQLAYKRFYRRPGYILKEVSKIRSFGEFYRKARVGLKALSV